jgi:hypothetical protein
LSYCASDPPQRGFHRIAGSALEANRVTFWTTIHSLRGGAGVTADPPITQPTPQQNPS